MHIAIDGYEANTIQRVGIGEYAWQILRTMSNILESRGKDNSTFVTIYLPESPNDTLPPERSFWKYRVRSPKKLWTFGALPLSLVLDSPRPDVVFSPTHYIPRIQVAPQVMSIMDLSYLTYPELFKKKDLHQLVNWTKYAAERSNHIFTISNFSRNAILKTYNKDPKEVTVTYPGVRMTTTHTSTSFETIKKKYQIADRFLLSVGTIQPRKNYEKLIQAVAQAMKQHKEQWKDIELVIVGKKGWLYESILEAPEKYGIKHKVHFLEFVNDEELTLLYKQAIGFVLVSLYEGFGLPVLEAMANGTSVVISNVSSLPEIAGDSAITVNPESVDSISDGLVQVIQESGTEKEKNRIVLGKKRSKEFNWEKAGKQTLEILEQIGSK